MGQLEETQLPGIGSRVDFTTGEGRRMGVVRHRGGRRELFVSPPGDPDRAGFAVTLDEDDAHSLVDALGVVTVTDTHDRVYGVQGLVIEWIDLEAGSEVIGRSIQQLQVRERTGTSIVAVLRGDTAVPAPEPDFVLEAGDTVVVAGTADGVGSFHALVRPS